MKKTYKIFNKKFNGIARFAKNNGAALTVAAVFASVGMFLLVRPQAAGGTLELVPSKQSVIVGSNLEVELRITPATSVDGVEAELSYDPTLLEFVSIDAAGSPFEVELGTQGGGNGSVKIVRGSLDGLVSSTATVAKVTFKSLSVTNESNVGLTGNATLSGSYTNPSTSGATVRIQQSNIGNLYIQPESPTVNVNDNFTTEVRLQPDTTVDGVEAELTYDPGKLQFVSIDASSSPFDVALGEQTGGNGKVTLTRGNLSGGVNVDALVAKVTFTALVDSGTSTIQISGNATSEGYYTHPATTNSTVTFKVPDSTPPAVSISSPANGTTVIGQLAVDVSASDNIGVTKVELYLDGQPVGTENQSPYNFSIDTLALANGDHWLQAKAYDAGNNIGTSSFISVTVKNWPEDINQDGTVNLLDFSLLATKYGQTGTDLGREDINRDGAVNLLDFSLLSTKFGQ